MFKKENKHIVMNLIKVLSAMRNVNPMSECSSNLRKYKDPSELLESKTLVLKEAFQYKLDLNKVGAKGGKKPLFLVLHHISHWLYTKHDANSCSNSANVTRQGYPEKQY